jgi:uncharacterized membrane protein (DUF485 family)
VNDDNNRQLTPGTYAPVGKAMLVVFPLFLLITAAVNFLDAGTKHQRAVVGISLAVLVGICGFIYIGVAVARRNRPNGDA